MWGCGCRLKGDHPPISSWWHSPLLCSRREKIKNVKATLSFFELVFAVKDLFFQKWAIRGEERMGVWTLWQRSSAVKEDWCLHLTWVNTLCGGGLQELKGPCSREWKRYILLGSASVSHSEKDGPYQGCVIESPDILRVHIQVFRGSSKMHWEVWFPLERK